jgi:hypothetical protein
MTTTVADILQRAVRADSVRPDRWLTLPRSWGVYRLPADAGATRHFRFGNHPVRMTELEREFGACRLEHLFLSRDDAQQVAAALNGDRR